MSPKIKSKKFFHFPTSITESFDNILLYPMVVLEASSGYGKTTAILNYMGEHLDTNIRQYSYTCLGEPPEKAWKNICSLLAEADAETAWYLSQINMPSDDTIGEITKLMDKFCCNYPTVLMIDNYQLTEFKIGRKLFDALSVHHSPNLHIIILTQPLHTTASPSAMNPRIYHISSESFRFSTNDICIYFQNAGIELNAQQTELAYNSTGGWIAALKMQLIFFQKNGTFENTAKLSHLMASAFWSHISEQDKKLLISISMLNSFTVKQAAIICGVNILPDAALQFFNTNDFIYYDENMHSYTFHNLLRFYLQEKLLEWPDNSIKEIYQKSGDACAAVKDYANASRFYAKTKDFTTLLSLPFCNSDITELVQYDNGKIIAILLNDCPLQVLLSHPELILKFMFELFLQGILPLFEQLHKLLQTACTTSEIYGAERMNKIRGELIFLEFFTMFNDINAMFKIQKKAYAILSSSTQLFSATDTWTFGASSIVYLFWRESGQLRHTLEQLSDGLPLYNKLTSGHGTGAELVMKAEMFLLSGNDNSAEILCYKTLYQAEKQHQNSICFCVELILARIAILRGDQRGYANAVERIAKRASDSGDANCIMTAELCNSFLNAILGLSGKIPQWYNDASAIRQKVCVSAVPFAQIIYAKLIFENQINKKETRNMFEGTVEELIKESETMHMLLPKVYYLIYLAMEKDAVGQRTSALSYLTTALSIAMPDMVYLPFAEHYKQLLPLLQMVQISDKIGFNTLLSLGKQMHTGVKKIKIRYSPQHTELTVRERETALLAKEQMSTKKIGEQLGISPQTVNTMLKSIYNKLDIHSKAELLKKNL